MVAMAVIAQLEAVGGLPEWAVYVALHLPDAFQRARTVEQLLTRHASEWAADAGKHEFLLQRLQIPAASLSVALALWAQVKRVHSRLGIDTCQANMLIHICNETCCHACVAYGCKTQPASALQSQAH